MNYLCRNSRKSFHRSIDYSNMEIYFIRHTSVAVPKGTCYGKTDVQLSDTFEQEASITWKTIEGVTFDKVYTSPLTRAVKLASYCGFPHAVKDTRLMELDFGEWEMKNYDHLYKTDPRFPAWCDNYVDGEAPGGESFRMLVDRVKDFIDEIKKGKYDRVAVFTHGGVLASALILAGEVDINHAMENVPTYGSVVKLKF